MQTLISCPLRQITIGYWAVAVVSSSFSASLFCLLSVTTAAIVGNDQHSEAHCKQQNCTQYTRDDGQWVMTTVGWQILDRWSSLVVLSCFSIDLTDIATGEGTSAW